MRENNPLMPNNFSNSKSKCQEPIIAANNRKELETLVASVLMELIEILHGNRA